MIDAALPQDSDKLRPGGTLIADVIAAAVGDRRLVAVVCTHSHNDHVNAAPALAARYGAPILLHPAEAVLPADTTVHTGHGPTTTIGAEAPHLDEWIARGH